MTEEVFEKKSLFFAPPEMIVIPGHDPGTQDHWLAQNKKRLLVDEPFLKDIMYEGVHTPIDVVREADKFLVCKGRRRVFHARLANVRFEAMGRVLLRVPCVVRSGERKLILGVSASENIHRLEFSMLDKAREAQRLFSYGANEEEVATYLGATTTKAVGNWRKLLELADEVLEMVDDEKISATAALQLHGLPLSEQVDKAREIVKGVEDGKPPPTEKQVKRKVDPSKTVQPSKKVVVKFLKACDAKTLKFHREFIRGVEWARGIRSGEDVGITDDVLDVLRNRQESRVQNGTRIVKKRK